MKLILQQNHLHKHGLAQGNSHKKWVIRTLHTNINIQTTLGVNTLKSHIYFEYWWCYRELEYRIPTLYLDSDLDYNMLSVSLLLYVCLWISPSCTQRTKYDDKKQTSVGYMYGKAS